jgi:hypothetical protein
MPYTKSPRPYKHEYQMQLKRDEHERRMERQRARRAIDKKYPDDPRDKDRTAEAREGKDIAHVRALDKEAPTKTVSASNPQQKTVRSSATASATSFPK